MICANSSSVRISSRSVVISLSLICRLIRSRSPSRASIRSARSTSTCMSAEIVFNALKKKCGRSCALSVRQLRFGQRLLQLEQMPSLRLPQLEGIETENDPEPQPREQQQLQRFIADDEQPRLMGISAAQQRIHRVTHAINEADECHRQQRQPDQVPREPLQRLIQIRREAPLVTPLPEQPQPWRRRTTSLPRAAAPTTGYKGCAGRSWRATRIMISQNAAHSQSNMRPGEITAIRPRRASVTGAVGNDSHAASLVATWLSGVDFGVSGTSRFRPGRASP